jgi:hypothetical protein
MILLFHRACTLSPIKCQGKIETTAVDIFEKAKVKDARDSEGIVLEEEE